MKIEQKKVCEEFVQKSELRAIVDDGTDITTTFKAAIEESNNYNDANKKIEAYTSNKPVVALNSNQISMIFFWLTLICHI
jgi:hypothetical protein